MTSIRLSLFKDSLLGIRNAEDFERLALDTFRWQFRHISVYREWCDLLGIKQAEVRRLDDIPFLPISFFKTHHVRPADMPVQKIFLSSGTGGSRSRHELVDEDLYRYVSIKSFETRFGPLEGRPVFALLPHYLENGDSSLVSMCRYFMEYSGHPDSGFFLDNESALVDLLKSGFPEEKPAVLFGAAYALLDLAEAHPLNLKNVQLFETGGMKGRKKEMIRKDLHTRLRKGFGLKKIYSEYGMTELLSQAYLNDEDAFECPPWMQLRLRDARNPLDRSNSKRRGCINVIDLANRYSCSFIATDDLGKRTAHGISVLGRLDKADIRGCNLLVV